MKWCSLVQSPGRLGRQGTGVVVVVVVVGDMRDDSAEILFQTFLQEALVGGSGTIKKNQQGKFGTDLKSHKGVLDFFSSCNVSTCQKLVVSRAKGSWEVLSEEIYDCTQIDAD